MKLKHLGDWISNKLTSLFSSTVQEAAKAHSAELEKLSAILLELNKQIGTLSTDVAELKEKSKQPEAFFASKNQNVSPRDFWF